MDSDDTRRRHHDSRSLKPTRERHRGGHDQDEAEGWGEGAGAVHRCMCSYRLHPMSYEGFVYGSNADSSC